MFSGSSVPVSTGSGPGGSGSGISVSDADEQPGSRNMTAIRSKMLLSPDMGRLSVLIGVSIILAKVNIGKQFGRGYRV